MLLPHIALLAGDFVSLSEGFKPADVLHVAASVDGLRAGDAYPVLGFRVLLTKHKRVMSVTAYVPGRQKEAIERDHLRFPDPLSREVVFSGMLPIRLHELEVDVYAEALRLERADEGRVVRMVVLKAA